MRYALALASLLPTAAIAQTQCAPIQTVIEFLGKEHKEVPVLTMNKGGSMVLVFAGETGSWTMVVLNEDKLCIVADGTDFRAVRPGGRPAEAPSRSF